MIRIVVGADDFDAGAELFALEALGGGGVASFIGVARSDGGVEALELEHYPGMTENVLTRLAEDAAARWTLLGVTIIHRVGVLCPGARIVLVATCARHRGAALESCAALIDQLKTTAPFWKRERRADSAGWVDARDADNVAAARWTNI